MKGNAVYVAAAEQLHCEGYESLRKWSVGCHRPNIYFRISCLDVETVIVEWIPFDDENLPQLTMH